MTRSQRGIAGEAAVVSAFTRLGVPVFLPFGDGCAADLVADIGEHPWRIQVKSSAQDHGGAVTFDLRRGAQPKHRPSRRYAPEEADWFALYAPTRDAVMLIRCDEVRGRSRIRLRFDAPKRVYPGQRYARDYMIDQVTQTEIWRST